MDMPDGYDALISAVLTVQPSAIIVTQAGTPISMPWRSEAQTMIHSWYGGNESGNALADIIFGKANPCGKLPMTFPDRLENTSSFLTFGSDNGRARYNEGYLWGIDIMMPLVEVLHFRLGKLVLTGREGDANVCRYGFS